MSPAKMMPLDRLMKQSSSILKKNTAARRSSGLNKDLSLGTDGLEDPYI